MVVLNRPEKAREFLLEVTELDGCQLARVECEAGNGNSVNKEFSRSIQICF
jgi:hypothetical protein